MYAIIIKGIFFAHCWAYKDGMDVMLHFPFHQETEILILDKFKDKLKKQC